MQGLEDKVFEYIEKYKLLHFGDGVVVGVSGGADSVCLLLILKALQSKLNLKIHVVTVHHGIREKSADADVQYVCELAKQLKLEITTEYADVPAIAAEKKLSEEEAGRQVRYECFYRVAVQMEKDKGLSRVQIAVAHHQQDNCETVLHNLLRGSGLKGLSGMTPVNNRVIRPLLCCNRGEIEQYLKERQVSWQVDETNASLCYTRNKIRKELIPYMEQNMNAHAVEHILQASMRIHQADMYFEKLAEDWIEKYAYNHRPGQSELLCQQQRESHQCYLPVLVLMREEEIVRSYIYRRALSMARCPLKDVTSYHLLEIDALCFKKSGKLCLPADSMVCREYEYLKFYSECRQQSLHNSEELILPIVTQRIFPYHVDEKIPQNIYTKWIDYDKIKGNLQVRTWQKDDYLEISLDGTRKKLKRYMIDAKIPLEERHRIPLVADGHHILWIIGYRISEGCKITKSTLTVMELTVERT